jgi:transcriptional regulator with XRE-family HTH domain
MTKRDTEELMQSTIAIGEQIKTLRVQKDISQSELARIIGARQPVISRIEKGTHVPTWRTLEKISKALDAKVEVSIVYQGALSS